VRTDGRPGKLRPQSAQGCSQADECRRDDL